MPEQNGRSLQQYDAMTSEQLAQLLRSDSEAPEGNGLDIDTLLYISGVLAEREKTLKTGKTAQQAWTAFQQHYMPSKEDTCPDTVDAMPIKPRKPWLRRAVAAAAVVAMLVFVPLSAKALNWEKIWTAVATWAKETFSFVQEDQPDIDRPEPSDSRVFDTFQHALEQAGEDPDIIPAWLPEGYMIDDILIEETPAQRNFIALYKNGEKYLRISVRSYIGSDPERIEVNDDLIEVYSSGGMEYHIFLNNERVRAIWAFGACECYISGEITVEQIKMMIDSIPKG